MKSKINKQYSATNFLVHDLEPALASFQTIVGLSKRGRSIGRPFALLGWEIKVENRQPSGLRYTISLPDMRI